LSAIIDEYQAANPSEPLLKSFLASIKWETFLRAIFQNDINLLLLKRQRVPTRDVTTMQEKLTLRPYLAPVVDWCMAWIRETRRNHVNPTLTDMTLAWNSEKAKDPNSTFLMVQSLRSTQGHNALSTGTATWIMKKRSLRPRSSPSGIIYGSWPSQNTGRDKIELRTNIKLKLFRDSATRSHKVRRRHGLWAG
jgi:hypothetical protein